MSDLTSLQVIDISDPAHPELTGTYMGPYYRESRAMDVTVSGDYAFVADDNAGLQVIQVFQSEVDSNNNTGQSEFLDAWYFNMVKVRLVTTQTNAVTWELSADGGWVWQGIAPDGNWNTVTLPGSDLVWRSKHKWAAPGVNPV